MGVNGVNGTRQINDQQPENVAAKKVEQPPQPQIAETSSRDTRIGDSQMQGALVREQLESKLLAFNNAAANPNGAPPIDEKKVSDALRVVRENLSEGAFDWDVSHGDLKGIENKLKTLNSGELNSVFQELSPNELKKYTSELEGSLGGYSATEKKQLFDHLAKNLNGANLSKLASAMDLGGESSSLRPGQADEPLVNILARSVAENAAPGTKAEFVKHLAANADKHQNAGAAAAEVLASMKNNPALLKQTLEEVAGKGQLQAIVDGAARKTEVSSRGGVITNYDPEPLKNLLNAVASIKDENGVTGSATIKAKIFEISANKLTEIGEKGQRFGISYAQHAGDQITNALTGIIDSDTTGVMSEMERLNRDGRGMTAYTKSMIRAGNTDKLGEIINRLQRGNNLDQNPLDRFAARSTDSRGDTYHRNASIMGYFAGSVISATNQITGDRTKQADILKNIFGTVAGVGGAAPNAGAPAAIANGLTTEIVNQVVNKLNKGNIDLAQALTELTYPREANGDPYEGAAEKDYDSAKSRVLDRVGD